MKKLVAYLLTFLVVALLPQLLLMQKVEVLKDKKKVEVSSNHVVEDIKGWLFKNGKTEWMVNSPKGVSLQENNWLFHGLEGQFFGDKNFRMSITSKVGKLNFTEKKVFLEKNIHAQTSNNYDFKTESLSLFQNEEGERFFEGDQKVVVFNHSEDLKVYAEGIKGGVDSGEVDLLSDVSCQKSVKNYKDVKITSDHAHIKSTLKTIRFSENLKISQEKFNIKGEEAFFEYDDKLKGLKSIKIQGDILASDGVKTALSEKVEMRTNEDVIIFQGNPRVRVGKNEMVGEEILITNQQKNVQVIRGNIKSTKDGAKIDGD